MEDPEFIAWDPWSLELVSEMKGVLWMTVTSACKVHANSKELVPEG